MIESDVLEKLEYFKVINHIEKYCTTINGKNEIQNLRPCKDVYTSVKFGNQVNGAKEIIIKTDYPPIEYLPDLNEALSKSRIEGTTLRANQILDVLKLAELSRKMFQFLKSKDTLGILINEFGPSLFVDKVFEHFISKIFDVNGEIKDDASSKLCEIRSEIREKESALQKQMQKLLKRLSESYLVQEEYITLRDGRIVVPVKSEHKRHVKGFVHSESASGQTVYIEPEETLELNNEILSLSFAEKREIEKILSELTKRIGSHSAELKNSLSCIANLDSIFARAKYSIEIIGSQPTFNEKNSMQLIDARHPILLKRIGHQNTIPLDLKLDNVNVILITGPNAGGKTVTLKTTGLLVCLAQAGIPIPANPDSNFHFFENVLVDIGDAQSIEDDLSTFSSHLKNIKHIIEQANDRSLILLDEIGTGTDPAEGSAIAAGMLISLCNKNAKVLATTHHGGLKIIANQMAKFQNASMEFNTDELRPTYRFNQGMPGSSYAFEVANRIGFDEKFIELAKQYLDTDKTKIEDFLVSLEKKSKNLKEQLNNVERENVRLVGLTNLYQNKIEKLEAQKKIILAETKEKAEIFLNDVNKRIEDTIKNIRESQASKDVIKEEKKKVEEIKKESKVIFKKDKSTLSEKFELNLGDYATIKDTSSSGIISELNKEKNKAVIKVGSLKIKTKYSDLIPAEKKEEDIISKKQFLVNQNELNYRLDIRGKRADEAEFEVIKFLDTTYMTGIDRVEILHGKGTGALKQLVHGLLRNNHSVKNYYFAGLEYGGDGITIVEFK